MDVSHAGKKTTHNSNIRFTFGGLDLGTGRVRIKSMVFQNTVAFDKTVEVLDGSPAVRFILNVPASGKLDWSIPFDQEGFLVRTVSGGGSGPAATVIYEDLP